MNIRYVIYLVLARVCKWVFCHGKVPHTFATVESSRSNLAMSTLSSLFQREGSTLQPSPIYSLASPWKEVQSCKLNESDKVESCGYHCQSSCRIYSITRARNLKERVNLGLISSLLFCWLSSFSGLWRAKVVPMAGELRCFTQKCPQSRKSPTCSLQAHTKSIYW